MFTLKFLILSIKILTQPQNIHRAIKFTQKQRLRIYFHSQPCILPITSHFDAIFIIIISVERQNVVVKTNIFTMFHNLKPRTIFISTRGRSIPLFIWQLIEKLSIIDLVRANKQEMILWCGWLKWPTSQPPTKKIICEMTFLTCYSEDWCVLLCMDRS